MFTYIIRFITALFMFITLISCNQPDASKVSLDVKVGQMITAGFRGTAIADTNHIVRDIKQYHLGGVVLFDYDVPADTSVRNITSPEQLKSLVGNVKKLADRPLLVSIDQEGGKVVRLKQKYGFPKTVSAQYLGDIDNADSTRHYARQIALTLSDMDINMNFAPVVDLNTNPQNPVIGNLERSFSKNPDIVTKHARIFINTMHNYDILTALKHFPGHGSSKKDSHLGVVDVSDTWSDKELIPYRQLIDSNLVDAVMTAHIFNAQIDSSYPATLSKPTVSGVLRDSLGFNKVVISDDLMMGAIRKEYGLKTTIKQTLQAGVDMLVFSNNSIYDPEIVPKAHRIIKQLIDEGVISEKRIDKSYQRIMKLKNKIQ
ncbi:beta-N-acetylhexosaminidase [Fodinibius salinus]|uniref:beta-N-acetylhexosaminidase n=1 Tax=Fodinibius salinus TaxID=860790 RepID=A0A5D3YJC2_9BACT|nr:glycoside hydrolase family 3 N-terminal domain-containing protein [Fodinibius salinus]TYP92546.1 beta-N-acetylhexosaminidase [Fodinibius salinus]